MLIRLASGAVEPEVLSIGALSERTGVAPSALRFYEAEGLINARRTAGGQRQFTRDVIRRVSFIRVAQQVGLSLDEIREALASLPDNRTPTQRDWHRLATSWRPRIDAQIALGDLKTADGHAINISQSTDPVTGLITLVGKDATDNSDVFTLTLDGKGDFIGEFKFELHQAIKHPDSNNSNADDATDDGAGAYEDNLNFTFTVVGTDGDCDSATGQIKITIDDDSPIVEGGLRAPWKWERLIVEASVVGGDPERWRRRLRGLRATYDAQINEERRREDPESPRLAGLERDRRNLDHLASFALPIVDTLASSNAPLPSATT